MKEISIINKVKKFPDAPGVYIMRDEKRQPLYIGKASSLRKRVLSHFVKPTNERAEQMLSQVAKVDYIQTDSVIEALIRESILAKKYQPKYNVRLRDDKTFLGVYITKEDFPRIFPARITEQLPLGEFYGPFTSAKSVRDSLQILRKIFPFCSQSSRIKRPCFYHQLGFCAGPCAGKVTKRDYGNIIRQVKLFLTGKKAQVIKQLEREMKRLARRHEFERAAVVRNRLFSLRHIQDVALVVEEEEFTDVPHRIEAYDISNIHGAFAVGSMVVFTNGIIDPDQYRKFKIKRVRGVDDVSMLKEVLSRRFSSRHIFAAATKSEKWPLPNLILIDGGKGQLNAAIEVLRDKDLKIDVVAIAKGPDRKQAFLHSSAPKIFTDVDLFKRIRDEAHRFAISYYRLRHRKTFQKTI